MAGNTNLARLDYGNWVPWKLLAALFAAALVLFVLSLFLLYLVIGAVVFVVILMVFAYERYMFSPRGGNVQAKLWDLLVSHLDWDGNGHIIDIGCGSGPVTIRVAKKYPRAEVLGLDYWGKAWEYSKAKCEQNAKIENVQDRVSFQKGDAAKLPFEDGFFDAAVSNLAFHEVGSAKDKRDVLKEALRVVRKGGAPSGEKRGQIRLPGPLHHEAPLPYRNQRSTGFNQELGGRERQLREDDGSQDRPQTVAGDGVNHLGKKVEGFILVL